MADDSSNEIPAVTAEKLNLLSVSDLNLVDIPKAERFFETVAPNAQGKSSAGNSAAVTIITDANGVKEVCAITNSNTCEGKSIVINSAGDSPNLYIDKTTNAETVEQALFQTGVFDTDQSNHSDKLRDNGFFTLYYLVRKAIGNPITNTENILNTVLGEEYDAFIKTNISDMDSLLVAAEVDIGTAAAPAIRTITHTGFAFFVNKYPQVLALGQERKDMIQQLKDDGTTLSDVASEYDPQDPANAPVPSWEPAPRKDGSTHFIFFENPNTSDEFYREALVRDAYVKSTIQPGESNLVTGTDYRFRLIGTTSEENWKYALDQKIFKGANILGYLPNGIQIKIIKEGLGRLAYFSQVEILSGQDIDISYDGPLYIDSRNLKMWQSDIASMKEIKEDPPADSDEPQDAAKPPLRRFKPYEVELPKIEVPEPNAKYLAPDWTSVPTWQPWLDEKTNEYNVVVEISTKHSGGNPTSGAVTRARKTGIAKLLRFYDKKRSMQFRKKLVVLNNGLFARVADEWSSPRQDKTHKYLVAVPRTYFEHPALQVNDFRRDYPTLKELAKGEMEDGTSIPGIQYWLIFKASQITKWVKDTKNVILNDFAGRIRVAKESTTENYNLDPKLDPKHEAQLIDDFIPALRSFMDLNDAKLRTDKDDVIAFGFDKLYRIEFVLYQQVDFDPSKKQNTEGDTNTASKAKRKSGTQHIPNAPSRYLRVGIREFRKEVEPFNMSRTMAYLRYGPSMSPTSDGDQYPGLELIQKYTLFPTLQLRLNDTNKTEEREADILGKQDKIGESPSRGQKNTYKGRSQLQAEADLLGDLEAHARIYADRAKARTPDVDAVLENMEDSVERLGDPEEYYQRLINKIDLMEIIAAAHACLGKTLSIGSVKNIIRKNILKSLPYEPLKSFLTILSADAPALCPDLFKDSRSVSLLQSKVDIDLESPGVNLSSVIAGLTQKMEDDYLCFSQGAIKSTIRPYSNELPGSNTTETDNKNIAIPKIKTVNNDSFTKSEAEKLKKDLSLQLVNLTDSTGIMECLFKILDENISNLPFIRSISVATGIAQSFVKKLFSPESFSSLLSGNPLDYDDPEVIFRIEFKIPDFLISELPGAHDDPLTSIDDALDDAIDMIIGSVISMLKSLIDEFIRACSGAQDIAASLDNVGGLLENSKNEKENLKNSIGKTPGLGKLPSNAAEMSPQQLKDQKCFSQYGMAPSSTSALQYDRPGGLNIYSLFEDPSMDSEIIESVLEKTGRVSTNILISEMLELLDELSVVLKPSEISMVMLGTANTVIYKLILKVISTQPETYSNLASVFESYRDVKDFFVVLGKYIDVIFCTNLISNLDALTGICERNLQDEWYCEQLAKKGYSQEQCEAIISKNQDRDMQRLEYLGDLLLSENITDLIDLPPIISGLGRPGMIPTATPYVRKMINGASDSFINNIRTRFNMEVRGIPGFFIDEVYVEGGADYKRPPEKPRDYISDSEYQDRNYNDPENWPQADITERRVGNAIKLNLMLDNSNILSNGPVNIFPTQFQGVGSENPHLLPVKTLPLPAKSHYTSINYQKMLESQYIRYSTATGKGTRSIPSWKLKEDLIKAFEDSDWWESQDPDFLLEIIGKEAGGFVGGLIDDFYGIFGINTNVEKGLTKFLGEAGETLDEFTVETMLQQELPQMEGIIEAPYHYDITVPVVSTNIKEMIGDMTKGLPGTSKLVEVSYPKYLEIRSADFIDEFNLPAQLLAGSVTNKPFDTATWKIFDRTSQFNLLSTQFNNNSELPGGLEQLPTMQFETNGTTGDSVDLNIMNPVEEAADALREKVLAPPTGENETKLDITDPDIAKTLCYQQWLFSALFTDSFGDLIEKFDNLGSSSTKRRKKFMQSCLKIYDLSFSESVNNLLEHITESPIFEVEVFEKLKLTGIPTVDDYLANICNNPGQMNPPPSLGDLLNTESLKDLARAIIADEECKVGDNTDRSPFQRALERIAVIAYIRVTVLESILRGLLIFTIISPVDLLKGNKMFSEYIILAIKRSAMMQSPLYYDKILSICLDIVVSDVGCAIKSELIQISDGSSVVFEKYEKEFIDNRWQPTIEEQKRMWKDALNNKRYNLEWVLHDRKGQRFLDDLKRSCLLHMVELQIEELGPPISEFLTTPELQKYRLEVERAFLITQRDKDGRPLEKPYYYDMPLHLIDYAFYKGDADDFIAEVDGTAQDSTYFPRKYYGALPTTFKAEKEYLQEKISAFDSVDINIDNCNTLFSNYEYIDLPMAVGHAMALNTGFVIGSKGHVYTDSLYINVGSISKGIRTTNRSSFYEAPANMKNNWLSDTLKETAVEFYKDPEFTLGTTADDLYQAAGGGILSQKMTPLGEATKNGGFAIQRYLKVRFKEIDYSAFTEIEVKGGVEGGNSGGTTSNPTLQDYQIAFNFGFDGGIKYNNSSAPVGATNKITLPGGSGPTEQVWYSPQTNRKVNDLGDSFDSSVNKRNYFQFLSEQGECYMSRDALDSAIINSILFTALSGVQDGFFAGSAAKYFMQGTVTAGSSQIAFAANKMFENTIGIGGSPWLTLGINSLSHWIQDIKVGQRLVYVFPHNMDIIADPAGDLTEASKKMIKSQGFTVLDDGEVVLEGMEGQLKTDETDDSTILDTSQEWQAGSNNPGSFAKILYKNLKEGENSVTTVPPFSNDLKGKSGEILKDELYASRYMRQQEMVSDPESMEISLKRVYSLPIKGCFAERTIDLDSQEWQYSEFLYYYSDKQKELEKQVDAFRDELVEAYSKGDKNKLEATCLELGVTNVPTPLSNQALVHGASPAFSPLVEEDYLRASLEAWYAHSLSDFYDYASKQIDEGPAELKGKGVFMVLKHTVEGNVPSNVAMHATALLAVIATVCPPLSAWITAMLQEVSSIPVKAVDKLITIAVENGLDPTSAIDSWGYELNSYEISSLFVSTDSTAQFLLYKLGYPSEGWMAAYPLKGVLNGKSAQFLEWRKDNFPSKSDWMDQEKWNEEFLDSTSDFNLADIVENLEEGSDLSYIDWPGMTEKKEEPLEKLLEVMFSPLAECVRKKRILLHQQFTGKIANYCQTKDSSGDDIDEQLTKEIFKKTNGSLLGKYILSEDAIRNLAMFHVMYFPLDSGLGPEKLLSSTKELLYTLGESGAASRDDYFYEGTQDAQMMHQAAMNRSSTSRSDNPILSYFQDLTPKMILKGFVKLTDPAWKRAFSIQNITGITDLELGGLMLTMRPSPPFIPPVGDPTIPMTPYGYVYWGLSFLEPLSAFANIANPNPLPDCPPPDPANAPGNNQPVNTGEWEAE
jgi:hypothetical protein